MLVLAGGTEIDMVHKVQQTRFDHIMTCYDHGGLSVSLQPPVPKPPLLDRVFVARRPKPH